MTPNFLRFALVAGLCLALTPATLLADGPSTIYRDKYGIPTIVSEKLTDAAYGFGYACATDNAERMGLNYKQARGRSSEVLGKSQLIADGFIRSLGIEEMAIKKADNLKGEVGDVITAFCAGANAALEKQKGKIAAWIGPFTPVDVLALAQTVNAAFALQEIAGQLMPSAGSNQFALAPSRTKTGRAILSADPHLEWEGILAWYEFGYHTRDMQFHGITISGLPFGVMGHSNNVAWCMTNNNPTLFNFYTVKSKPGDPSMYNYHGEWKKYDNVAFELNYMEGGEMKVRRQTVKRTVWGPMLPLQSRCVSLTMLNSWDLLPEALMMARAKNAAAFREALRPCGISMWNIVYADTTGKIGYQFNARIPHREAGIDWHKTVAGDDPKTKWGPLYTIDELPHIENPKSGILVNANSSPWLTPTDGSIKSDWPNDVTTYGHTSRYDRLSAILLASSSTTDPAKKIGIEDAKKRATDTMAPYGLEVAQALNSTKAENAATVSKALAVLKAWDGHANQSTKGTALYAYWLRADRASPALAKKLVNGSWTSDEQKVALDALAKAADQLTKDHGSLDIAWGNVHVSHRGGVERPIAGFGYITGRDDIAAVMPTGGSFANGKINCAFGSSYRMIVDLNPKGVHSWTILPFGDSQSQGNPHFADQAELYSKGEYKPTAFGLKDVMALSTEKLTVNYKK